MDRASLEEHLSQGLSLAEIGKRFGKHEATVAYWMKKHELAAVNSKKHTAKGGLNRGDLEKLVDTGASIAEIARPLSSITWTRRARSSVCRGAGRVALPHCELRRESVCCSAPIATPRSRRALQGFPKMSVAIVFHW